MAANSSWFSVASLAVSATPAMATKADVASFWFAQNKRIWPGMDVWHCNAFLLYVQDI